MLRSKDTVLGKKNRKEGTPSEDKSSISCPIF